VAQSQFLLQFLVVPLDHPAVLSRANQFRQARVAIVAPITRAATCKKWRRFAVIDQVLASGRDIVVRGYCWREPGSSCRAVVWLNAQRAGLARGQASGIFLYFMMYLTRVDRAVLL
jgi:hypothetical protein